MWIIRARGTRFKQVRPWPKIPSGHHLRDIIGNGGGRRQNEMGAWMRLQEPARNLPKSGAKPHNFAPPRTRQQQEQGIPCPNTKARAIGAAVLGRGLQHLRNWMPHKITAHPHSLHQWRLKREQR